MAFEIAGWPRFDNAQRRFTDTRARKIEERIGDILVSFAAIAAGKKVERAEEHARALREEAVRQRRAEQARLAKLEADRVEYLQGKLAQALERDRLAMLIAALNDGAGCDRDDAYGVFLKWAQGLLGSMNARLSPETIAGEVSAIEAFSPPSAANDGQDPA